MGFDTNIDYSGYRFITPMFNAIVNRRVMSVKYAPFDKEAFTLTFHPYFLKQYNNRWFVFGYNEEMKIPTWNLALDRIVDENETNGAYKSDSTDWEDYFFDIIGVTRPEGNPIEVELLFESSRAPYIETKPLHPTQKARRMEDSSLFVRLKLIPNKELTSMLLSFGNSVQILSPVELRQQIKDALKSALSKY
jgi:predicted DNA-binding transcriptional regulator YafY